MVCARAVGSLYAKEGKSKYGYNIVHCMNKPVVVYLAPKKAVQNLRSGYPSRRQNGKTRTRSEGSTAPGSLGDLRFPWFCS